MHKIESNIVYATPLPSEFKLNKVGNNDKNNGFLSSMNLFSYFPSFKKRVFTVNNNGNNKC